MTTRPACRRPSLARRSRREIYRLFARWAAEHALVVVEKLDLRAFAERPDAEEDVEITASRPRRFKAGLAELLGAMADAVQRAGGTWLELPAAYTTRTCAACGSLERTGADLWHTCSVCAVRWDQDHNAARNLLRAAQSGAVSSGRSRQKIARESEIGRRRREGKARAVERRSKEVADAGETRC